MAVSLAEVPEVAQAQVYDGVGFRSASSPLPTLAAGELTVEVELATVCGSDLHTIAGDRATPVPTVLGHEGVGRVVATGPDAPAPVGQRVTWGVVISCGECDRCRGGLRQKCRSALKYGHEAQTGNWWLNGTFASHVHLLAGTDVVPVPESLPAAVAAPANCATATVMGAARRIGLDAQDCVVVIGCGLLGLTAVAYARWLGVRSIIAVDIEPTRRASAVRCGADRACTPAELGVVAATYGARSVLEFSGHPSGVEQAIAVAEVGARVALVGSVSPGSTAVVLDPSEVVRKMLTVVGSHNYEVQDLRRAVEFLTDATDLHPVLADLVSPPLPLGDMGAVLGAARSGRWVRASTHA